MHEARPIARDAINGDRWMNSVQSSWLPTVKRHEAHGFGAVHVLPSTMIGRPCSACVKTEVRVVARHFQRRNGELQHAQK
jgi:hypothetical protein